MMAMVPPTSSGLLPLLESLEDSTAGQPEQTEAYLTIANRLSGDDGTQFLPAVVKHFPRLGKTFQTHISSQNAELSQAALQALGFCVFHVHVVSAISANFAEEILSALSSLVVKSTDKNTCTRALWVISKQNFPTEVVAKKVPEILRALECVRTREDIQSVVMEHESLNVVISLLEQASAQMGEDAVQWAKLVIPLVVHSASKVRLRAAAALEMGLPLLLEKQKEVAAILEPLMSSVSLYSLQKLFSTKNETNVLKLWPLFVRLLGKLLHRGGPFINSLLGLEELGFRSSSPNIKKIAFIAWKSLIDNFALNPEILCSAKRLKLLLQPLSSIQVRTEALLLTKLEVWWYLVVKLGANLPAHFEQVGVPLLQCTLGPDSALPATPSRSSSQCSAVGTTTPKSGSPAFSGTIVPRLNLNTSVVVAQAYPSIQLLGLEMLLHYFLGSEVTTAAAKNKLTLSLGEGGEPISHPFLSSPFSFTKHAPLLITAVHDSFICIGKDAPGTYLMLSLFVSHPVPCTCVTVTAGNKKDRQGSEVLTLLLQALQSIISSEALPANRALGLLELTVKGIPQRVLGSASYQVGKMDVLNGTPALFLILLFYNHSLVAGFVEDERFFLCLETLVSCGLSGPTSPLAFGEAVLAAVGCSAGTLENKEQLWRMWSLVVNPLTDTITQTNEVNQGDALEHNFSAVLTALMFPIIHLLPGKVLPQMTQKAMLGTWCGLYKVFARCSALVATAEENVCCEELCVKMAAILDRKALKVPATLHAVANILLVIAESADFSPYTPQFQQKMKSPHNHLTWVRKKSKALGNLYTFQTLLVQSLETFNALEAPETAPNGTGLALVSILSILFSNLSLGTAIQEALASLSHPLVALYEQKYSCCVFSISGIFLNSLEKLLSDVLGCLQIRSALAYDDELLSLLSPLLCVLFLHRRKQVRSLATQFWNATFANTLVLVYPEELKPVLSQVKQNTPIILPGFQSVEVPDELSGQYSSESSQLETKLSGVQVTSGVKRDSLLPRAEEIKDRNSRTSTKPVSTKLDFGSHKLPRREELEEQASIDFVFIPPETKERVLTEHQKEVKRTKRVDIPAMYNNLDASLDTTVFTQYTQSQEESLDKLPADEQAGDPPVEALPDSADVSMEDANEDVPLEDSDVAMESREEGTSPIVSGGSDIISGTPKKHNSRRQSFITLEKYAEGKPASPASVVKFTGPLTRTLNSQEQEPASQKPSAEIEDDTDRQDSQETEQVRHKSARNESFLKEGEEHESSENKKESEVEIIAEKQSSETTEDDVIPDTQTQVEVLKEVPVPAVEEVMGNNSQEEEESKGLLEDSTSSQSTLSQGEPRRSGRRRSRPLRPGEDTEERDDLDKRRKKSQPGEDVSQTDSPKTTPSLASPNDSQSQRRASRRSKLAVEEDGGKDKLRKRSHKELSQSNSKLATPSPAGDSNSLSQGWRSNKLVRESEELVKDKRKRRGVAKEELSQSDSLTVTASDNDSQSQSRRNQRSKLAVEVEDDGNQKRKGGRAQKEKPSQANSHVAKPSQLESQSQGRTSRSKAVSDSEEFDLPDKVEKQDPTEEEQSQRDSQMATLSPAAQTGDEQSQGISSGRSKLVTQSEEQGKDKQRRVGTENTLSQIDSKITTPSATPKDSQSQGRASRKSKVPLEVAKLEDKTSPNVATDSAAAPEMSQTDSQVTPSATRQTDSQPRLRGRSSKRSKLEEQLKPSSSPMPTPTIETHSSQVADQAGTQESPQGSRRTTRRRASQGLLSSNVEESDTSETREDAQKPKKRGRNPKSTEALQSPLATVGSGEPGAYLEIPMDLSESSLKSESEKSDLQNPLSEALEVKIPQDVDETIKSINSLKPVMDVLKLPLITKNNMGQREENTEMVDIEGECENTKLPSQLIDSSFKSDLEQLKIQHFCISPRKNLKTVSSQEGVHSDFGCEGPTQLQNKLLTDSEQAYSPVPSADGNSFSGYESVLLEPNKLCTPPISNGLPTDTSPSEAAEEKLSLILQVAESSGEKLVDVPKPVTVSSEEVTEEQMGEDKENRHPESTNNVLEEDQPEEDVFMSIVHTQPEGFNALDEEQQEEQYTCIKEGQPESDNTSTRTRENDTEPQANDIQDITPLQERAKMDTVPSLECEEEDGEETRLDNNDLTLHPLDSVAPLTFDTCEAPVPLHHPSTSKDVLCQDSPPKQKGLEAMMGLEVGQSPSSGRIRGMWTPSASPSTSILKKGQKRSIEEESSSPFTKSRRVSFADPIQHQELADDIDRRSPVIRSSSPRPNLCSILQYITTPTKGLMILSPRNLCSPGYKSSKKCLISEMSQEPRPIPKDCVYPALVSCSTPVEAVLPQITSNMWPRGFGHLVRARNIKTVGDLSALTPSEIKNLPIRSPKISNVKTALKTYHEQQRKGRSDELKSFEEMENMTSELEEPTLPQNQEEEDKTPGEALATEMLDEQGPEERPDHQRPEGDLLLEVESLGARLAGEELSRCSPDQLVQLHDQLGGMMKNVVVQLQSRLLSQNKDSGP
uniref:Replication timing regulatory factor 1 n=1 Tax=Oncorhynchus kisutch TaxID=8019 RepID=A0A8C7D049_ONCKI